MVPVEVKMHRSTSLDLPAEPKLPGSLVVRRARIKEAGALAALCGQAYKEEIWEPKATELELFHDDTVRAVMVVADGEQLLATASLQVHHNTPDSGQVRWVATELDWRRRGLAKALVVSLLKTAIEEECKEVHLKTTSDLTGAIALYLQLGFEPFNTNGS